MRKTNASGDEVRLPIMYQLTTTDPMVSKVNEHPVRDESPPPRQSSHVFPKPKDYSYAGLGEQEIATTYLLR